MKNSKNSLFYRFFATISFLLLFCLVNDCFFQKLKAHDDQVKNLLTDLQGKLGTLKDSLKNLSSLLTALSSKVTKKPELQESDQETSDEHQEKTDGSESKEATLKNLIKNFSLTDDKDMLFNFARKTETKAQDLLDLLNRLAEKFKEQLVKEDSNRCSPLRIALYAFSSKTETTAQNLLDLLNGLLEKFREQLVKEDSKGWSPFRSALYTFAQRSETSAVELIELLNGLLEKVKEQLVKEDSKGWSPFRSALYAFSSKTETTAQNLLDLLNGLAEKFKEQLVKEDSNGWSPLRIAFDAFGQKSKITADELIQLLNGLSEQLTELLMKENTYGLTSFGSAVYAFAQRSETSTAELIELLNGVSKKYSKQLMKKNAHGKTVFRSAVDAFMKKPEMIQENDFNVFFDAGDLKLKADLRDYVCYRMSDKIDFSSLEKGFIDSIKSRVPLFFPMYKGFLYKKFLDDKTPPLNENSNKIMQEIYGENFSKQNFYLVTVNKHNDKIQKIVGDNKEKKVQMSFLDEYNLFCSINNIDLNVADAIKKTSNFLSTLEPKENQSLPEILTNLKQKFGQVLNLNDSFKSLLDSLSKDGNSQDINSITTILVNNRGLIQCSQSQVFITVVYLLQLVKNAHIIDLFNLPFLMREPIKVILNQIGIDDTQRTELITKIKGLAPKDALLTFPAQVSFSEIAQENEKNEQGFTYGLKVPFCLILKVIASMSAYGESKKVNLLSQAKLTPKEIIQKAEQELIQELDFKLEDFNKEVLFSIPEWRDDNTCKPKIIFRMPHQMLTLILSILLIEPGKTGDMFWQYEKASHAHAPESQYITAGEEKFNVTSVALGTVLIRDFAIPLLWSGDVSDLEQIIKNLIKDFIYFIKMMKELIADKKLKQEDGLSDNAIDQFMNLLKRYLVPGKLEFWLQYEGSTLNMDQKEIDAKLGDIRTNINELKNLMNAVDSSAITTQKKTEDEIIQENGKELFFNLYAIFEKIDLPATWLKENSQTNESIRKIVKNAIEDKSLMNYMKNIFK